MMRNFYCFFIFIIVLTYKQTGFAALDIELTKGIDSAIPVAVVPFAWESENGKSPVDVSAIIAADLRQSGRFNVLDSTLMNQFPKEDSDINIKYWRKKNVENVVVGRIQPMSSGGYKLMFSLVDLYKKQTEKLPEVLAPKNENVLVSKEFIVKAKDLRRLAHHVSDIIYKSLTGEQGMFSTRIAYVLVQQEATNSAQYSLEISDMDGHNGRPILRSEEPIMSPSWSPDGSKVAYVSFENKRPRVFISEIATGKREIIASFPGINGAPAWSPDGKKLALALSKGHNPNIYLLDLATGKLKQLTNNLAINTEPSWSPDGKFIIFTSDRGGSPQVYQLSLATHKVTRLTFEGRYNTSASFSPDGKNLVLLHGDQGRFNIATMDLQQGILQVLTTSGLNESPSFAPNGRMIVFATKQGGVSVLGIVSVDGRVRLRLPGQNGSVQEPVWSPFRQMKGSDNV